MLRYFSLGIYKKLNFILSLYPLQLLLLEHLKINKLYGALKEIIPYNIKKCGCLIMLRAFGVALTEGLAISMIYIANHKNTMSFYIFFCSKISSFKCSIVPIETNTLYFA